MSILWIILAGIAGFIWYFYPKGKEYALELACAVVPALIGSLIPIEPLLQGLLFLATLVIAFIFLRNTASKWNVVTAQEKLAEEMIGQLGLVKEEIGKRKEGEVVVLRKVFKATDLTHKGISKGEYVRVRGNKKDVLIVEATSTTKPVEVKTDVRENFQETKKKVM